MKPEHVASLKYIANLGGNQSDENLTSRTGPNDAVHRGLMYVAAREIAVSILEELGEINGVLIMDARRKQ